MKTVDSPSPNFDERGRPVDMLVLHYTGTKTAQEALDILRDPASSHRVSAHYLVEEDGTVHRMVPEEKRAWHAGVSSWRGNTDINARSVGIEIANPGHEYGYRAFPPAQMQAVAVLAKDIIARHRIPSWNVVAHSDIAPARKQDPGELFDWKGLSRQGIGMWPEPDAGCRIGNAGELQAYGYDITNVSATIAAFQRHFRPSKLSGEWDAECGQLLAALLAMA